ncbi:hypothetical protein A3731_10430 [Roseovarius sp. HI0049]|nr:hypothetical protein A3731_38400 [Roseovarius sp. HI0049]KZY44704.1 hypothetical protein A3731_10430 [Roseovarius sp. HI0049]
MHPLPRFALARAALIAIALVLGVFTAHAAEPRPDWRNAASLSDLIATLDHWLDAESPYPARATAPRLRLISPQRARAMSTGPGRLGATRRGLYDPDTQTIYLVRPWSMRNPQDVSVLLHELAHHRQATAQHWYCPGQQELPAYRLQEAWLAEQGARIRINWIAATLAGGCTPHDFHPD